MKTSLHKAAESGMYDVCKELLKAGSKVEALDMVSFNCYISWKIILTKLLIQISIVFCKKYLNYYRTLHN